ncbi:hypothetical protein [Nocardioides sp.]|uniref:hypothetical protein n=1 Tax=Nocardioides sp. TaxID=35761 RepID=UPI002C28BB32|nr:hypothetical protein [Nocardioides sp.]HXH77339.1 hypothetical protein [Nocardioides sp.]
MTSYYFTDDDQQRAHEIADATSGPCLRDDCPGRQTGEVTTYSPDERPDVEVLVNGVWHPGELRAWQRRDDGWWANVQWRPRAGETYIDTVPAIDVRVDETTDPRWS